MDGSIEGAIDGLHVGDVDGKPEEKGVVGEDVPDVGMPIVG